MMDGNTELKTRRTAPKEVRRQQLIDSTIAVVADKGVTGATMAAVTGQAGLSMGIVNLHFESKDNLLKSTLVFLSDELQEAWRNVADDTSRSTQERLWAILAASFLPQICTFEKVRTWYAFFGEAQYRAYYRDIVRDYDDQRSDALELLLEELTSDQLGFDAENLSSILESLSDGLWLSLMLYPEWMTADKALSQMWDVLCTYFPQHFDKGGMPNITEL